MKNNPMTSSCSKSCNYVTDLKSFGIQQISVNESLKNYSSWRIGGPADYVVEPSTIEQLACLRQYVTEYGLNHLVIGDGSNLLFADEGFRGIIIKIGRALSNCRIVGNRVHAQAGIAVPRLARKVGMASLTGMEHAVGIPGTLGGLVAMNGGSQRKGIGEVIETVRYVNATGRINEMNNKDCEFAYRHSIFLERPWIITDVVLRMQEGKQDQIRSDMLKILRDRRHKFPRRLPNCGSVFKSDPALYEQCGPPGKVIEELGLKGFSVGDAQISPRHANFIVNTGNATASDILELIKIVRETVHEKTNIWLNCEARHVSPEGRIQPAHSVI